MNTERARELLEAERRRLQAIIDEGIDGPGSDGQFGETDQASDSDVLSYAQHNADAPQETIERERDQSVLESARMELAEVEHAFARLEDGTYGVSERSGEPIPDERLEARPATRFTVEEQAIDEKQAGSPWGEGDPTATSGGRRAAR